MPRLHDQAQSKYLGELVKLSITEQQAQRCIEQYGISKELIRGKQAEEAIDRARPWSGAGEQGKSPATT